MLGSKQVQEQPVNAPWIQCGRLVRVLLWVVVVEAAVIAGLAVTVTAVFPLKTIEPVYVEFQSAANNFVKVVAAGQDIRANELVLATQLRKYVKDRETVDKVTESERYAQVMAMSDQEPGGVADVFHKLYGNPETGMFYKPGAKREVQIVLDTALAPGVHQVEFKTFDTQNGQPVKDPATGREYGEWTATIAYEYADQSVSYDKALLNPTGLVVMEYSLAKRRR